MTTRGLTLIEMMISVVLTLMVVFALVQVFETFGATVGENRALIEMSGNLRNACHLLEQDVRGVTVTTLPPRDPGANEGYIEYIEGKGSDRIQDATGAWRYVDTANISQDTDGDGFLNNVPIDTSVGDVDDFLALTTRNESTPFSGRITSPAVLFPAQTFGGSSTPVVSANIPTQFIESNVAEVVWWIDVDRQTVGGHGSDPAAGIISDMEKIEQRTESDQIKNAVSDFPSRAQWAMRYPNGTPMRSLHRRALLIRPDLIINKQFNSLDEVASFLSNNDLSVRVVRSANGKFTLTPNSLGDLTDRGNRAARLQYLGNTISAFENLQLSQLHHPSDSNGDRRMLSPQSLILRHLAMKDMILKPGESLPSNFAMTRMMRRGEDVVLSDCLGFDIQLYDPQAPVLLGMDNVSAVTPSDPGYHATWNQQGTSSIVGRGAYVDLGWYFRDQTMQKQPPYKLNAMNSPGLFAWSPFSAPGFPTSKFFLPATDDPMYCTWNDVYERDGRDQDKMSAWRNGADQGTNGLDDDNANGVDDPGERETIPPYPYPLRGISVKIRTMEFNTRQVRQSSVTVDFLPE